MIAFKNHFTFEFNTGLRNHSQLLMNYLFPLIFYVTMGSVMTQINPLFKDTIIPAMIAFATMTSTILGLPGPAVQSREAGVYRSYKINGVPALSIVAIPALTATFHVLIVATIITLTAAPFFSGAIPTNWVNFALVTVLTAFAFSAIGTLIGVIANTPQSCVLASQLIFLPSMLLGGLMMPLSILPPSVRPISALLPASYTMQAYLGLAYNQETVIDPWISLIILLVGGLLAFVAAIYLFKWDTQSRAQRRHSLLAFFSRSGAPKGSL